MINWENEHRQRWNWRAQTASAYCLLLAQSEARSGSLCCCGSHCSVGGSSTLTTSLGCWFIIKYYNVYLHGSICCKILPVKVSGKRYRSRTKWFGAKMFIWNARARWGIFMKVMTWANTTRTSGIPPFISHLFLRTLSSYKWHLLKDVDAGSVWAACPFPGQERQFA